MTLTTVWDGFGQNTLPSWLTLDENDQLLYVLLQSLFSSPVSSGVFFFFARRRGRVEISMELIIAPDLMKKRSKESMAF